MRTPSGRGRWPRAAVTWSYPERTRCPPGDPDPMLGEIAEFLTGPAASGPGPDLSPCCSPTSSVHCEGGGGRRPRWRTARQPSPACGRAGPVGGPRSTPRATGSSHVRRARRGGAVACDTVTASRLGLESGPGCTPARWSAAGSVTRPRRARRRRSPLATASECWSQRVQPCARLGIPLTDRGTHTLKGCPIPAAVRGGDAPARPSRAQRVDLGSGPRAGIGARGRPPSDTGRRLAGRRASGTVQRRRARSCRPRR